MSGAQSQDYRGVKSRQGCLSYTDALGSKASGAIIFQFEVKMQTCDKRASLITRHGQKAAVRTKD